jgi:hypothetical protein
MSENEDFEAPAPVRTLPRSSAGLILDNADRAFIYRVVAVHAAAGLAPARSLEAMAESLSEVLPTDPTPSPALGRRAMGARALAEGMAGTGESAAAAILSTGFRLGPLERACLRVPMEILSDLKVAAAMFGALADLFEGERRR